MGASTATILVVDDDSVILDLLDTLLTRAGYGVLRASDGRKAIALLRANPVDLMITDLVMPEQEGVETISLARAERPALRIIAVSGYAGRYLRMAELLGADAVLPKPFANAELLATVARLLESH